jgi:5-methylcytosine-specific restriction endonuclease McrA
MGRGYYGGNLVDDMKLQNRFKEDDKIRVWSQKQYCQECGSNQNCSLHHICGTESDSIINSIMLCYKCHKIADGHNVSDIKFQQRYINKTLVIIREECYEWVERDRVFINNCIVKGMVLLL